MKIVTKTRSHKERYANDLRAIRELKAVKWAKISGKHLLVCTKRGLRHVNANRKVTELSSIVIRFNLDDLSAMPYYSYLPFSTDAFSTVVHPVMKGGIGLNFFTYNWGRPCVGDWRKDYINSVRKSLKDGVETIIQMIQCIYHD